MMLAGLAGAALVAGLLGSGHCVGMCAPVVGLFERATAPGRGLTWQRRLAYQAGRLTLYATIGAIAGTATGALSASVPATQLAMVLRAVAAVALLMLGLRLLVGERVATPLDRLGAAFWRAIAPLARYVVPLSTNARAFGAGLLWGALPCGMVYATAGLALASASATGGALVMAAFWLGTLPAMLSLGVVAQRGFASRWRRLAGAITVAMAIVALVPLVPAGSHSHSPATGSEGASAMHSSGHSH